MCTMFGDYYDHISDLTKLTLFIYAFADKYGETYYGSSQYVRICVGFVFVCLGLLTAVHVGLQEAYHAESLVSLDKNESHKSHRSHSLGCLRKVFSSAKNYIYLSKYFGIGTSIGVLYTFALIIMLSC